MMVDRETPPVDVQATALTRLRYQRLAPIYDRVEGLMERRYGPWRAALWRRVSGRRVLEVGVGTGKNMPYWPVGAHLTAIDLTPGMLAFAHRRASQLLLSPDLRLGDVQALGFADASFDTAVATFVFCSVPDPILGLRELGRVVRPGGQVLLLEHVRVNQPIMGPLMDALNPLVVRLLGANVNRRTVESVQAARLEIMEILDLDMGGMFKLMVTRPGQLLGL